MSLAAALLALAAAVAPVQAAAPGQGAPTVAGATTARDSIIGEQVRHIASELRCPVCQGLSLQDSPSELAQQMRQLIRDQLAAGKTPDEVKAYFVSKYSEWILLEPEPRGANLMVYVLPVLLVVGGGVGLFVVARRWTRQPAPEGAPLPEEDAETVS